MWKSMESAYKHGLGHRIKRRLINQPVLAISYAAEVRGRTSGGSYHSMFYSQAYAFDSESRTFESSK